jgi:hypothetical protein
MKNIVWRECLEFPALFGRKPLYLITHATKTLVKIYGKWIEDIFNTKK